MRMSCHPPRHLHHPHRRLLLLLPSSSSPSGCADVPFDPFSGYRDSPCPSSFSPSYPFSPAIGLHLLPHLGPGLANHSVPLWISRPLGSSPGTASGSASYSTPM